MVLKSVFMLSLFFIPVAIVISGIVSSPLLLFLLFIISGFGMAGIGMGVMHDALHGSYSKSRQVNKIMGYTMNLIGANSAVWKIQHNVLHHTYTNIDDADDDINVPSILRFSPNAEKHSIHKFQHIYIWFIYGISTILWITIKDFVRINRYRRLGFFSKPNEYRNELIRLVGWKSLYYTYALVLPLIMVPLAPWIIILAFFTMHFVTGVSLSAVFQTAHVMPSTKFPLPDENGIIANDWAIHQLATTTNFAPKSRVFSWLIGGLNYQIEHHLLPNVCHVHYRKLSTIVAQTAKEYGIPYNSKSTFWDAIVGHVQMLKQLGKMEKSSIPLYVH